MSEYDIKQYYNQQALRGYGSNPTFYRSPVFFKGHGTFGNIMTSILNSPILKKTGKYVGKKLIQSVGGVASDLLDGKNIKNSLKSNARRALESTKDDVASLLKRKMQYSPKRRRVKRARITPVYSKRKSIKGRRVTRKKSHSSGFL